MLLRVSDHAGGSLYAVHISIHTEHEEELHREHPSWYGPDTQQPSTRHLSAIYEKLTIFVRNNKIFMPCPDTCPIYVSRTAGPQ